MSIYHQIGQPDVTNERMTHLLKLDTFFIHMMRESWRIMHHEYESRIVWTQLNSVTLMHNTVASAHSIQYWYSAVTSKGMLYTNVTMTVTRVDGQARCNFHGIVQCYRQMLRIQLCYTVIFAPRYSSQWCNVTRVYSPLNLFSIIAKVCNTELKICYSSY